jgi:hypothetical protein
MSITESLQVFMEVTREAIRGGLPFGVRLDGVVVSLLGPGEPEMFGRWPAIWSRWAVRDVSIATMTGRDAGGSPSLPNSVRHPPAASASLPRHRTALANVLVPAGSQTS